MKQKIENYKIITDDIASLNKFYSDVNKSIKQILYFNSSCNKYKVIFYTDDFLNIKKYFGTIEKNGQHLSRLYKSNLKTYLKCYTGTDLQGNKDTLFFNFDTENNILTIKRKVLVYE